MNEKKSGFEPDPIEQLRSKQCQHPEHNPPGHLVVKKGQQYRHICPGCGNQTVIKGQQHSW